MLQLIVKGSEAHKDYSGPWAWISLTTIAAYQGTLAVYLLVKSDAGPNVIKFVKVATSDPLTDLRDWGVPLIVFDHCNGANRSLVDTCANHGFKTIAVSSFQMKPDSSFPHESYTVNGWKKEEYLDACQDTAFYSLVQAALQTGDFTEEELNDPNMREEVVAAKYHLAGGSARWMFQCCTDQLLSTTDSVSVDNLVSRVTHDQLERGFYGDRSIPEVNQMLTRMEDGAPVIVSQYVANCLAMRFGEPLVKAAVQAARRFMYANPAMDDGMLMKMEFVHRLGRSNKKPETKASMIPLITEQGAAEPSPVFESGA